MIRDKQGLTKFSKSITTIKSSLDLFIDNEITNIIIKWTNEKGKELFNENWIEVDDIEMNAFFGILFASGLLHLQKRSLAQLWAQNSAFSIPIFSATFSRERFKKIFKCIRFDDFRSRKEIIEKTRCKLTAVKQITDIFSENLKKNYIPSNYLTIDEQLVSFRGRVPFKVYMPSKPAKYGIKLWLISDCENYYCYNFQVYCGKGETREVNQGLRIVRDLTTGLMGGRGIITDNFFTSFKAAEALLEYRQMTLLGTMRKNKPEIPSVLLPSKSKEIFSSTFVFHERGISMVSYVPKKNKAVILLSSEHSTPEISNDEDKKPEIIIDYNQKKCAVDILDKMVNEYTSKRGTRRWTLILFENYLEVSSKQKMSFKK